MSQDSPIEIRRIKEVNIKGGTVLDGFPSAGLANAIASKARSGFPALSVINDSTKFPGRNIC